MALASGRKALSRTAGSLILENKKVFESKRFFLVNSHKCLKHSRAYVHQGSFNSECVEMFVSKQASICVFMKKRKKKSFKKQKDSDAGNRTRGKHVRDAYVTNYTTSEFNKRKEMFIVHLKTYESK